MLLASLANALRVGNLIVALQVNLRLIHMFDHRLPRGFRLNDL